MDGIQRGVIMADWQPTACILCECNCGLEVQLEGRRLAKLRGDKRHPISRGYACEKPHRLDHYQNGPHRLTTPLRRTADGGFEEIGWDVAIREVAARLAAVRDTYGGASIFYYGGGGQGNHLPGAYATATRAALGSVFKSSALAQEKTGEFWVADRMLGGQTRADFEHCDVAMFLGKNPWHSHSIARARVTLKEIAQDPARTLIVVDPRRTETAALADIHLQVRPGTDAWLLSAMVALLLAEDRLDHAFLAEADGLDAVRAAFADVDVAACCARAGVDEALVREAVDRIAGARAFASFEDLGVQMSRHSTLVSYLHRLVWLLTGSYGKPGTHYTPTGLVRFASGASGHRSPVVGAPIISGLVPCNVIAEEILTDHPGRYRAMIVEAANPAHSLADGPLMREALGALDTLVVIDVALSETAQLADYVLPAASQLEKAEATFFNFEFPKNAFHLRRRLLEPPPGALPEAEIHARLCEALGAFDDAAVAPLRAAAEKGLPALGAAFMQRVLAHPKLKRYASVLLYRALGPVLPPDLAEGAVLLGLAFRAAMDHGPALARAGFGGPPPMAAMALFQAILDAPSGVVFSESRWEDVRPKTAGGRIQLALEDLLAELGRLAEPDPEDVDFPYVLAAGERRSFTANTIIRDPAWRKRDRDGALRMSPADAARLGVATGDRVRLSTRRGAVVVVVEVSDTMQAGHLALPNGLGLSGRGTEPAGVAPNELTSAADRDPFAGTPHHKYVRARVEVA
ncbi:MAG: molybdopterin oxidoreductase family protein [Deltaproteobacteria bacterium]|nr:MAG: molybdopterin oxidoreductase family protein [Deltaproteobacteria bacterium]